MLLDVGLTILVLAVANCKGGRSLFFSRSLVFLDLPADFLIASCLFLPSVAWLFLLDFGDRDSHFLSMFTLEELGFIQLGTLMTWSIKSIIRSWSDSILLSKQIHL